MRKAIFDLYTKLETNNTGRIISFDGTARIEKTYSQFMKDVNDAIGRLNYLNSLNTIQRVGILGATSYYWMVLDHACIKGGYQSVALPETFTGAQLSKIIQETQLTYLIGDRAIESIQEVDDCPVYYFNDTGKRSFLNVKLLHDNTGGENKILKEYSIAFSSGTSEKLKYINLCLHDLTEEGHHRNLWDRFSNVVGGVGRKKPFFLKGGNRIIIYLPFSHPMQRGFALECLFYNIDIILSDPINCFKHIIVEKPNIMVSVPFVYEVMAARIKQKLEQLPTFKKLVFKVFNALKINTYPNHSWIKSFFTSLFLQDIKKIYGGKADLFVTGSAPINPLALKVFFSIGVRVYEAYGQSELSAVIMNTQNKFKIGSVGKPTVDTKIAEDSEILIKYDEHYDSGNHEILNIDEDGYIHTGDLGYLDKEGYLFINGRKDDVLILENGKKVHPANIERHFETYSELDQVVVIALNKIEIGVLVYSSKGFGTKNEMEGKLHKIIKTINKQLPAYEWIKSFHIVNEPFSIENNLLTATYKYKREAIKEVYTSAKFTRVVS